MIEFAFQAGQLGFARDRPAQSPWDSIAAAVVAGTSHATIACVGDSTTAGFGATSGDSGFANGYVNSYPAQLADILSAAGLPAQFNSFFGFQDVVPASHPTWNSLLSFGTGWVTDSSVLSMGGPAVRFTGASAGTLAFSPANAFDTFDIYYLKYGSNGSFTTKIDGGASLGTTTTSTVNVNGEVSKVSFSATLGTHAIQLGALANGDVYILGVDAYTTGVKRARVWNMGWGGAKATQYAPSGTFAWRPQAAIATLAPNLTIFNCTINDWVAGTTVSTYKSQMQTFITAAKISGSVILMTGAPSATGSASVAQQLSYINAVKELAATNACAVIDMTGRWISQAAMSAVYFDNLHPTQAGYLEQAKAASEFVRP